MLDAGISPSLMCADPLHLKEDVQQLALAGAQYFHIDVMDGVFVPNFALGPDFVSAVRSASAVPMDLHLMVQDPGRHLALFKPQPGDIVSVHQEATPHLQRVLAAIRETGATASVALNPGTPLCMLEEVLPDVGMVLLMTVNPGFAGQRLVPQTLDKLRRLRAMLDNRGYTDTRIEVDGNVSFEHAAAMRSCGADLFVAGTSSVFCPGEIAENMRKLAACLDRAR